MNTFSVSKHNHSIIIISIIMSVFFVANNHADGYESADAITKAIQAFVVDNTAHDDSEQVSVLINPFNHTTLSHCTTPLSVSFSREDATNQSNAVVVECHSSDNWRIYVPVHIQIMSEVLSVNHTLAPGDVITEADLTFELQDKNRLYEGYFKNKDDVIGLSAFRAIPVGSPLTKKNVKQMPLVKRGQSITLALKKGAIEIDMAGIAKSDGYLNGPVKIMNPSSKKWVDATVVGKDRAELNY